MCTNTNNNIIDGQQNVNNKSVSDGGFSVCGLNGKRPKYPICVTQCIVICVKSLDVDVAK